MASPYLPVTLTDLRVLVTAGAAGIGRTIAEAFLVGGARVWVCDIADAALADIASAQPAIRTSRTDVADRGEVAQIFAALREAFGGLDVLVNNAGIAGPTARVEDIAPDVLEHTVAVNALLPGHVNTERLGRVVAAKAAALGISEDAMRRRILDVVALKSTVEAADVANMALYLASPFGASITGQAISADGDVQMMQ